MSERTIIVVPSMPHAQTKGADWAIARRDYPAPPTGAGVGVRHRCGGLTARITTTLSTGAAIEPAREAFAVRALANAVPARGSRSWRPPV